jgi:hypothetical protein
MKISDINSADLTTRNEAIQKMVSQLRVLGSEVSFFRCESLSKEIVEALGGAIEENEAGCFYSFSAS